MVTIKENTITRCRSPAPKYCDLHMSIARIYGEDDVPYEITERSFKMLNPHFSTFLPTIKEEEIFSVRGDNLEFEEYEEISEHLYGSFFCEEIDQCLCGYGVCDIHKPHNMNPSDFEGDLEKFTIFDEKCDCFSDCDCGIVENKILNVFPTIHEYAQLNVQSNEVSSDFDIPYVTKLVEDIAWCAYLLSQKPTRRGLIEVGVTFAKLRSKDALTYDVYRKLFLDKVEIEFDVNNLDVEYEVQSMEFVPKVRQLLDSYKDIINSPIYKKIYKCIMYGISLNIFDTIGIPMSKMGYSAMEKAMLRRKFSNKSDFVYTLLDTILFVLEKGVYIVQTGDISAFTQTGSKYGELYEDAVLLKRQARLVSNAEDHGFNEPEFRQKLDSTIEKFTSIHKHARGLDVSEKQLISMKLSELQMIRDDLTSLAACREPREQPFGVLVVGGSGIGKSTITEQIYQYFAKVVGLPNDQMYKYVHNFLAKYWNNFRSCCWCIVMDDIAAEHPKLGDNSSVKEIIQIMNPVPYCPDQAALEDKGKTPCKPKLVIATTNVKTVNAEHYFAYPSAVQRRFPYVVTPKVKEEYTNSQGMLDSSLVNDGSPFADLWTYTVEVVRPVPYGERRTLAYMEKILENASQTEFYIWMRDAINKHQDNISRVKHGLSHLRNATVCKCCQLPDQMCLNIQSDENDVSFFLSTLPMQLFSIIQTTSVYKWIERMFCFIYFTFYISKFFDSTSLKYRKASIWILENLDRKDKWREMGNRVNSYFTTPKLSILLISVGSAIAFYKTFSRLRLEGQETSSHGEKPEPTNDERENVWYNQDFTLTSFEVSRQSSSAMSEDFNKFVSRIADNCVSVRTYRFGTTKYTPGKMTCLGGHIYITNNHNIPDVGSGSRMILVQSSCLGVSRNLEFVICEDDIVRYPKRDIAFLKIRNIPPKKNIIKYIANKDCKGTFKGVSLSRLFDGSVRSFDVNNAKHRDVVTTSSKLGVLPLRTIEGVTETKTESGDCGSLFVANTELGYIIMGIHVGVNMSNNKICFTSIDSEFCETMFQDNSKYSVESSEFDLLSSSSQNRQVSTLDKKSVFRYMNGGCANVFGSFTGFRNIPRSKVGLTPIVNNLDKLGYKIRYGAPVMGSYVPWRIGALDLVQPICRLSSCVLANCKKSYMDKIVKEVNISEIKKTLIVLDDFTALNGAAGVCYIDKLNRNTSAGNPWKKSKKYFLKKTDPVGENLDPVVVDEEIDDRLENIIKRYLDGRQAHPNFCAHLKDEPVSFKKIKMGKTRVFTGAPMDWSIIVRKFLLTSTRLIQNNRFAFEAAPGTIAQSLEWQEIYEYVTCHGEDRIIAGDYKSFDKRMSPVEILTAFDILHDLCELSGNFTQEELKVIRCIAEDTAFPLVDYAGDLVQFYGSNPSGNPLTVILNSIVNSLRMRYMYHELCGNCESFNDNVSLLTYGDDNIMSVSRNCDWFNHTSIARKFAEYGIGYTMADKEAESVPFINISDASFLKRTWRYDEDLKCFLAPLEHESIEKMLTVWTRSKSIPEEAQCVAIISTALREYFFYGKDIFIEKRNMFEQLIKEEKLECWIEESTLPTWDDLVNQFWRSSKHILDKNSFRIESEESWTKGEKNLFPYLTYHLEGDLMDYYRDETYILIQSDEIWSVEEYDIFLYPNYRSTTNYDISIHIWMQYADILNYFLQSMVFTYLTNVVWRFNHKWICMLIDKRCEYIVIARIYKLSCKYYCLCFLSYTITWCLIQILFLLYFAFTNLSHFFVPYFAVRYFIRL